MIFFLEESCGTFIKGGFKHSSIIFRIEAHAHTSLNFDEHRTKNLLDFGIKGGFKGDRNAYTQ